MGKADILAGELVPLLAAVEPAAAREFGQAGPALWSRVEQSLVSDLVLAGAGGGGAFGSARADHRFLAGVLDLRLAGLMVDNLAWFYRSAQGRGQPADLPPRLFQHWTLAVTDVLAPGSARPVAGVLRWILDHHDDWVRLAGSGPAPFQPGDARWEALYRAFLPALLEGRQADCIRLAEAQVRAAGDLGPFYAQVVTPALREVGRLWETGLLSVAGEHRACAVARRTCDVLNHLLVPFQHRKGRVVVSAAPEEWHDLGARILADLLAGDGWAVDYLGANVPARDLLELVRQVRPRVLALSLTVPFNLQEVRDLAGQVRAEHGAGAPRILLGGALFAQDPDLWRRLDADGHAATADGALALLEQWWREPDRSAR